MELWTFCKNGICVQRHVGIIISLLGFALYFCWIQWNLPTSRNQLRFQRKRLLWILVRSWNDFVCQPIFSLLYFSAPHPNERFSLHWTRGKKVKNIKGSAILLWKWTFSKFKIKLSIYEVLNNFNCEVRKNQESG